MAKIVYFQSPIDSSKVKEVSFDGKIEDALKFFDIDKKPLCVTINGETPDNIDLSVELKDTDLVEIRLMVEGGGNSDVKSTLAVVVQVAALIIVNAYTWGAAATAGILIGGQVIAGALNKWAADILASQRGSQEQKDDVDTNSYSLSSSNNEVRPLRPIPLALGSHRMSPDIHNAAFKSRYDFFYTRTKALRAATFFPGIIASNGPDAPDNSWATMPAGYLGGGDPWFPIKIAPYGFTTKTTALTPSENDAIIERVKLSWNPLSRSFFNFRYNESIFNPDLSSYPLVIYHSDPLDPHYRKFDTFWTLQRTKQTLVSDPTWYNEVNLIFLGNAAVLDARFTVEYFFQTGGVYNTSTSLMRAHPSSTSLLMPPTFTTGAVPNIMFSDYRTKVLLPLNGGAFTLTPKLTSPSFDIYFDDSFVTQVNPGIPLSSQYFNFGFGDLAISERLVGSSDVSAASADTVGVSPIDKSNPSIFLRWKVPNLSGVPKIGFVPFRNETNVNPTKVLMNPSYYSEVVSGGDLTPINWNFFRGDIGMDSLYFAISGFLYSTSSGTMASNTTRFQVQWKWGRNSSWNTANSPSQNITNANSNNLYIPYEINELVTGAPSTADLNDFLEVRIRKMTLDSVDNQNGKVSNLSVSDVCFYGSTYADQTLGKYFYNIPMNIEGLYLTALVTDSATSNRFSALVEAKCWHYDFGAETWTWGFTRNPAFWFLFYARGGFLNVEAMGTDVWPYSPTYGWQNYPGHPGNTDLIFGGGYNNDEIDVDKILEWAFFCEDNDLKLDMILKDEETVSAALEKIAGVGRASVSYYSGKLSVVFEDKDQVPVCLYGMGNIIQGTFTVSYAVGDPVKSVTGKYINRETWETETLEAEVPYSPADIVKRIDITIEGVTTEEQAQREVNLLAARQFFQRRTYKWDVDIEGFLARRGDLVYLSHDSTQYGYSGRVMRFVVEAGVVIGIKSGSIIGDFVSYVSVRDPAGNINTYECHFEDGIIVFDEEYPIEFAPSVVNLSDQNPLSDFSDSIPEDFIFIADIKETTGKRVRISQIEVSNENVFSITAVDEDPALWAYEYDATLIDPESFDDSIYTVRVLDVSTKYLMDGKVLLTWNMEGGNFVQIINKINGLPIEANGQFSFSKGEVILDLVVGVTYTFEVRPLFFGTPYQYESKEIVVCPL